MKSLFWVFLCLFAAVASAAEVTIDAQFPGGNIIVDSIQGDVVHLRPDLRTSPDWFYYAFRVKNAEGKTLRFVFERENRIGPRGPAISTDEGKTWRYLSSKPNASSKEFTYVFGPEEKSVRFALAILYTQKDWEAFVAPYRTRSDVRLTTLCKSRKGRDVELLRVGEKNPNTRFAVVLTSRHHCCEMIATLVMEGILQQVLSDDETGKWLRANAEFFFVPFMDKDGVEDGDQGKNRTPHDHNRDYNHEIYPEVKALKAQTVQNFAAKELVFLDLHCPWLRYGRNESIYFPMPSYLRAAEQSAPYFKLLEKCQKSGALPYHVSDNLPFGKEWNTSANYEKLEDGKPTASSKMWAAEQPNAVLVASLEIPYSNVSNVEVTRENCREFGHSMAKALAAFLKAPQKSGE